MPLDAPEPCRPSLVRQMLLRIRSGSATAHARSVETASGARWPAFAVAGLLALAPVLTISGAGVAERRTRAQTAGLAREVGPKLAAARAADEGRRRLRAVLATPTVGATLGALARTLPPDAALVRAERDARGQLHLEVAAPDPDRLRSALRRDPATAKLRDVGQGKGEGVMIVTLEERPL